MDIRYLESITASVSKDFEKHKEQKNRLFKKNYLFDSPFGGKKMLIIERNPRLKDWKISDGINPVPLEGNDLEEMMAKALYEKR